MFSTEKNGYNKQEVDEKFNQMLIEISALKNNNNQINKLNLNLVNALDKSKEVLASSKNIFNLKVQKIMIIYQTLENAFKKLLEKYPQVANFADIKNEFEDFSSNLLEILQDDIINSACVFSPVKTDNDTIRLLLNKMGAYNKKEPQQTQKQVSIKRKDKPEAETPVSNGFNLKEAINPKMDLDEIMKAFNLND